MVDFRAVYPDGEIYELVGETPEVGETFYGPNDQGFPVAYIRHTDAGIVAYLNPPPGETSLVKQIVVVGCPLTLAEAAELADRTRTYALGASGSPSLSVAVTLEHLIEEGAGETPPSEFTESEQQVLRAVIEGWLLQVRVTNLPQRVMHLRDNLRADAP